MVHKLTRLADDTIMLMTHTGTVRLGDMDVSRPEMIDAVVRYRAAGAIIDFRAAELDLPPDGVIDVAAAFAEAVHDGLKVAIVVKDGEHVFETALMTMVGQGRGFAVGEFLDVETAQCWIEKSEEEAAACGCLPLGGAPE